MADEAALQAAIAELGTAVDGLIAKAEAADVDLTDEVAALQDIKGRVEAASTAPSTGGTEEPPTDQPVE